MVIMAFAESEIKVVSAWTKVVQPTHPRSLEVHWTIRAKHLRPAPIQGFHSLTESPKPFRQNAYSNPTEVFKLFERSRSVTLTTRQTQIPWPKWAGHFIRWTYFINLPIWIPSTATCREQQTRMQFIHVKGPFRKLWSCRAALTCKHHFQTLVCPTFLSRLIWNEKLRLSQETFRVSCRKIRRYPWDLSCEFAVTSFPTQRCTLSNEIRYHSLLLIWLNPWDT